VKHNIGGEDDASFFSVFDGHGDEGHQCATYVKSNLVKKVDQISRRERVQAAKSDAKEKGVKFVFNPKIWPALTRQQAENMCKTSYEATNKDMRADKKVSLLNGFAILTSFQFCFFSSLFNKVFLIYLCKSLDT